MLKDREVLVVSAKASANEPEILIFPSLSLIGRCMYDDDVTSCEESR